MKSNVIAIIYPMAVRRAHSADNIIQAQGAVRENTIVKAHMAVVLATLMRESAQGFIATNSGAQCLIESVQGRKKIH